MSDITSARPVSGQPVATAWGIEVHDQLEGLQAGTATVVNASGSGQIVVTFPRAYAVAPNVVACPFTNSFYFAGVAAVTPTTVTLFTRDLRDGQTGSGSIPVQWIAFGRPA